MSERVDMNLSEQELVLLAEHPGDPGPKIRMKAMAEIGRARNALPGIVLLQDENTKLKEQIARERDNSWKELVLLKAKNEKLQEEAGGLRNAIHHKDSEYIDACRELDEFETKNAKLENNNDALQAALKAYGRHEHNCLSWVKDTPGTIPKICDCGLKEWWCCKADYGQHESDCKNCKE